MEFSAGHIQVFAARVMVLNNVFATGVKMLMVFWLVLVVSATPAGRSDNPLRSRVRRVVPLVNIRSIVLRVAGRIEEFSVRELRFDCVVTAVLMDLPSELRTRVLLPLDDVRPVVFCRTIYVQAFVGLHVDDVVGVSARVPDVPLRLGHMRIVPQVNVGPVMEFSAGHIQVFAARVMVLNNVFATGVKMLMVFRLVLVVSATPATAAGRS